MKTYYDVLQLGKNCTSEEIKDSYIKLSKKYHPDVNKNSDAQKKFVAVNEAYSVLGKTGSRVKYDASLLNDKRMSFEEASRRNTGRMGMQYTTYYDYMHAINISKRQGSNNQYFSKSKVTAFVCCCLLMLVGAGIQLRHEKNFRSMQNHKAALLLQHTQMRAHKMGRDQAIQEFMKGNLRGVSMKDIEKELDENSYNNKK